MGSRSNKSANKMKPHVPAKVKSPILEKVKGSPGGPHTPGEKEKRAKAEKEKK